MNKFALSILITVLVSPNIFAQSRYIVRFKDKAASSYSINSPSAYLSPAAIDRRTRYHIAIDSTDLPVVPGYIDSIKNVPNVTILNVSKWLNQVSIQTSDANALNKIRGFSFVRAAAPIANRLSNRENKKTDKFLPITPIAVTQREQHITGDAYNYGNSFNQIHIHNGEFLHNIGLRGQGMIIGMLDAGFYHYTSLKAFDSINTNKQVLGTWDFVNREPGVVEDYPHGMECLSTMAANIPDTFVGTAPKASFYLFRTEDAASEYPIEEHNWVCGAERVDSAGGDVISSSLGYTTFDNPAFNHTYADMNGNTTIAAIGADMAAKKGILVVNAAGNEGDNSWHYISTPADGDSVLAVGAVNTNGQVANFSSYGPSSDGQIKPDVTSVGAGTIVQYSNNTIGAGNGTSFACPNMAGLATCLWQGFREYNNIAIINALRQAGNIASSPDNRIGYGIPDVKKALVNLLKEFATSSITVNNCTVTLSWTSKDMQAMKYEIERKGPRDTSFTKIAEQQGTGNMFGNQTYQFKDNLINFNAGNISYRIRQVVDTATSGFTAFYMDTVSAVLTEACINAGTEIQLTPNPAPTIVTLKVSTADAIPNLQICMVNTLGQTVFKMQNAKPANTSSTYPLPVAHLAAGVYFVSVYNGNNLIATKRFIKL